MEKIITKERDYFFDNLKGLLIFVVVFGHFIGKMRGDDTIMTLYSFIYMFHMPLFILVSGFFSKKFKFNKVIDLILVYLLWQIIVYPIMANILSNKPILPSIFKDNLIAMPRYTYWYILSLIGWKIITPILPKNWFVFAILVAISFIPGLVDGIDWAEFSWGRTLSFYPFFYLGYILDKDNFEKFYCRVPKKVALVALIGVFLVCGYLFVGKEIPVEVLHYKSDYYDLVQSKDDIVMIRSVCFALAILTMTFICSLVSKENTILAKWGRNSFIIFITHGVLIKAIASPGNNISPEAFIIIGLAFTYGYCEFLSMDIIKKYIGKLTNISFKKLKVD
ncbi:MAG: acyltransferase family protein [Peptostreptococcaceae bacterium]